MTQISTVTRKGQVTIPVSIRRQWDLDPRQKVVFIKKKDAVEIRPVISFFDLRGSVKTRKKYSDQKADRRLKSYFSQRDN